MSRPGPESPLQGETVSSNSNSINVSSSYASPNGTSNLTPSTPGTTQRSTGGARVIHTEAASSDRDRLTSSNSREKKRTRPLSSDTPPSFSPSSSGRQFSPTFAEGDLAARQYVRSSPIFSNLQPTAARAQLERNIDTGGYQSAEALGRSQKRSSDSKNHSKPAITASHPGSRVIDLCGPDESDSDTDKNTSGVQDQPYLLRDAQGHPLISSQSSIAAVSRRPRFRVPLPPLPSTFDPSRLPPSRKPDDVSYAAWDNILTFCYLRDEDILGGAVHPDDLCGTLLLYRLIPYYSKMELEERICKLRKGLKYTPDPYGHTWKAALDVALIRQGKSNELKKLSDEISANRPGGHFISPYIWKNTQGSNELLGTPLMPNPSQAAVPRTPGSDTADTDTSSSLAATSGTSYGVYQRPAEPAFTVSTGRESDHGRMLDLRSTIREQRRTIQEQEQDLEGRDGQIADLTMEIAEVKQKLEDKEQVIKLQKKQISDLRTEVERLEGIISQQAKGLA